MIPFFMTPLEFSTIPLWSSTGISFWKFRVTDQAPQTSIQALPQSGTCGDRSRPHGDCGNPKMAYINGLQIGGDPKYLLSGVILHHFDFRIPEKKGGNFTPQTPYPKVFLLEIYAYFCVLPFICITFSRSPAIPKIDMASFVEPCILKASVH